MRTVVTKIIRFCRAFDGSAEAEIRGRACPSGTWVRGPGLSPLVMKLRFATSVREALLPFRHRLSVFLWLTGVSKQSFEDVRARAEPEHEVQNAFPG